MGSGEEESDNMSMGPGSWTGSRGTGGARSPRPLDVHSEHETQLSHVNLDPWFFLSCQELKRAIPSHPLFHFGCSSILLMETRGPKKDYNMCTVTG